MCTIQDDGVHFFAAYYEVWDIFATCQLYKRQENWDAWEVCIEGIGELYAYAYTPLLTMDQFLNFKY